MDLRITASVVIVLLAPLSTFAQNCDPVKHTAQDCLNIVSERVSKEQNNIADLQDASTDDIRNARRDLRISTTGDVPINVAGSSVSLNDLLPVFNIAVEPGTPGDREESSSIVIEYSPTRAILGGDMKASFLAKAPDLSDPIKKAINDPSVSGELESGLDYSDDVTVALTYAYAGTIAGLRIGRTDSFYEGLMDGMLAAANTQAPSIINNLVGATINALIRAYRDDPWKTEIVQVIKDQPYGRIEDKLRQANLTIFSDKTSREQFIDQLRINSSIMNSPLAATFASCESTLGEVLIASADRMAALSAEYATCIYSGFVDKMEGAVFASLGRTASYNQFLINNGFFKLGALVNNQPQLLFSGTAQFRDSFAGGNKIGAKLSFEFDLSGHNINNLNRYLLKSNCSPDATNDGITMSVYSQCATQIGKYITDNPVEKGGWRGSLNVEYNKRDNVNVNLPNSMTSFFVDGGDSLIASFVAGRQFQMLEKSGLPKAKLDIGISYDNVSDDPMRQDRALGTITFSQQIAPAAQLSIGLVWANKAEFRGDVDKELSAKIGLSYKFANIGSNE